VTGNVFQENKKQRYGTNSFFRTGGGAIREDFCLLQFAFCLLISPVAYMQVGSEAYGAALTVYNYAKNSPSGTALEGVAEELGRRFARKPRPTEPKPNSK
jgi:hypothetical protein